MTEPTDKELLEFVATFVGLSDVHYFGGGGTVVFRDDKTHRIKRVPDYLHSLDAFARDVWPKIPCPEKSGLGFIWQDHLEHITGFSNEDGRLVNASARDRCLALYRAMEGKDG